MGKSFRIAQARFEPPPDREIADWGDDAGGVEGLGRRVVQLKWIMPRAHFGRFALPTAKDLYLADKTLY